MAFVAICILGFLLVTRSLVSTERTSKGPLEGIWAVSGNGGVHAPQRQLAAERLAVVSHFEIQGQCEFYDQLMPFPTPGLTARQPPRANMPFRSFAGDVGRVRGILFLHPHDRVSFIGCFQMRDAFGYFAGLIGFA